MKVIGVSLMLLLNLTMFGQIVTIETYYDKDSTLLKDKVQMILSDSSLTGTYSSFYQNGSKLATGFYIDGIPDSSWKYYYETGKLKAEGSFKLGKQTGSWTYYYENGSKKAEGYITNGIRDGYWINYFENGSQKSEGSYWDGIKTGIWNYFYEDESIKAQAYYENGSGYYKEFYPTGTIKAEGSNKNEKSIGEWKYYWETGELQALGNFENGLKSGLWEYYHKNGNLSALGEFKNGERTGLWKYYHENGNISSEGNVVRDKKDGTWNLYYDTGELMGVGDYNKNNGSLEEYYPSGTLKAEGEIINGQKNGTWIYYDEKGVKEGQAIYNKNIGEYKGYYPDGGVKMQGTLNGDRRIGVWTLYDQFGNEVGTYRPIYEEDKPFFKVTENKEEIATGSSSSEIPEYRYKTKSSRYYDSRINEFKAAIISVNPAVLAINQLGFGLEFYMQERLGYELEYRLFRKPFFTSEENIGINSLYRSGNGFAIKQKYYSKERRLGLFYFGHEVRFNVLKHKVKVLNGTGPFGSDIVELNETNIAYGGMVGWRWMKSAGQAGWTSDVFLGIDIGYRNLSENYSDESLDQYFTDVNDSKLYIPIQFGISLGWAGPKQKKKGNE